MQVVRVAAMLGLFLAVSSAFAHVTLAQPAALSGTTYRAALGVGHGCDGFSTTALKVSMPAGFRDARPMPKPGWTVVVRRSALQEPYDDHGKRVTEGVSEITWTATSRDNWLPDAYFDEFVFRGRVVAKAGPMWFKVIQTCEQGNRQWVDVPLVNESEHGLKAPAALLDVIDGGSGARHHH